MSEPPELVAFEGNWPTYEAKLYAVFLESFVNAKIFFGDGLFELNTGRRRAECTSAFGMLSRNPPIHETETRRIAFRTWSDVDVCAGYRGPSSRQARRMFPGGRISVGEIGMSLSGIEEARVCGGAGQTQWVLRVEDGLLRLASSAGCVREGVPGVLEGEKLRSPMTFLSQGFNILPHMVDELGKA